MNRPILLKPERRPRGSVTPVGYLPLDSYHIVINVRLWLPFLSWRAADRLGQGLQPCDRVAL